MRGLSIHAFMAWASHVSLQPCSAVVLFLLVSACAANGPNGNQAAAEQGSRSAEADLQYYPIEDYQKYPSQIRELLRRHAMENGRCRGNDPDVNEKLRACNRRHRLLLDLERHGWCLGGGRFAAEDHWLPCSKDPNRNGPVSREMPFPEVEGNGVASEGR